MIPRIQFDPTAPAPLDGIRVVDLSRLVAGNMVSLQLADQGAEVIKIEDPKVGDPLRAWRVKGLSLHWKVYARNKKSLAINLRPQAGRDALLDLLATSHILIENYRPGRWSRWDSAPISCMPATRADHRSDHRLRPGRPVPRPARLRHAGGGDVRFRRQERLRRPAAGAATTGDGRHGLRPLRRLRGDGRPARCRAWRQGPDDRPAVAGSDDLRAGSRRGVVPVSRARSRSAPAAGR